MADYLFVYGTLRPELAQPEVVGTMHQLKCIGRGVIRGFLYNLGEYPGLRLDANGDEVQGEIFELNSLSALRELDSYEGYDPKNPKRSLFIRRQCQVQRKGADDTLLCWVYEYNRDPAASQRINAWPPKK